MKPTLTQGIMIALVLTAISYCILTALTLILWTSAAISLTIVCASTLYCFILLTTQNQRKMMLIGTLCTLLPLVSVLLISLSPIIAVCLAMGGIWLTRCILGYRQVVACLLDAGLVSLATIAAIACGVSTNSLVMGIWVFFLLQSLCIFIPSLCPRGKKSSPASPDAARADTRFNSAYRMAQSAIERITVDTP